MLGCLLLKYFVDRGKLVPKLLFVEKPSATFVCACSCDHLTRSIMENWHARFEFFCLDISMTSLAQDDWSQGTEGQREVSVQICFPERRVNHPCRRLLSAMTGTKKQAALAHAERPTAWHATSLLDLADACLTQFVCQAIQGRVGPGRRGGAGRRTSGG